MLTVPILIIVWTSVTVPLLCMVSAGFKSKYPKGKQEEQREGNNDTGCEKDRLEKGMREPEDAMHEDGVKLKSRSPVVDTKQVEEESGGVRIAQLDCTSTFESLTPTERLYAHHSARAYFEGALMVFLQTSPEAAGIFIVLYRIFWFDSVETLKEKADDLCITESEWRNFLLWSAFKLTVRGKHFVPMISHIRLWKLIASSTAASMYPDLMSMYEAVENVIYSPRPVLRPGFPAAGAKSNAIIKEDYDICNKIVMKKRLMRANCRFYKKDVDGEKVLKIKVATTNEEVTEETVGNVKVQVEMGDYAKILEAVCGHLKKASEHAANILQKGMLWSYNEHFRKGDCEHRIIANSLWLKDRNPIVRSKYYFLENRNGQPGLRSEFIGFVAAVNKEATEKCARLVDKSSQILEKLPWGRTYEKDVYVKPDFAVVDLIADGFNAVTKGHNFYDDDTLGRSQVYSNVISTLPVSTTYLKEQDRDLLRKYDRSAQEVFTGLHELFGHGSGKMFKRNTNGSFNFDHACTMDILTGCKVASWYEPTQSYVSVFGGLAMAFEECRAYAVAYMLCCDIEVMGTLGYTGATGQSIKYIIWLRQLREGLRGLTAFDICNKNWRSGHAWARFVLLKVVLEAGEGLLTIKQTKTGFVLNLDRSKIDSVGMPAIRRFLKKQQAYKSTADVKGATALFNRYSVGPSEALWIQPVLREEIRSGTALLFVQPNSMLTEEGGVELVTYEATAEGVIQSVIDRYNLESVADLEELWKAEKK